MSTGPAAVEREVAARLRTFDLATLQPHLPLRFPSTAAQDVPEHFRTRSWYRYPGWAGLTERAALEHSSPLYIALHLIDFSPLRAELVLLLGLQVNGVQRQLEDFVGHSRFASDRRPSTKEYQHSDKHG